MKRRHVGGISQQSGGAADNDITIRDRHGEKKKGGKKQSTRASNKTDCCLFGRRKTLQTMQFAWLTAAGRGGLIPSEEAIIARGPVSPTPGRRREGLHV